MSRLDELTTAVHNVAQLDGAMLEGFMLVGQYTTFDDEGVAESGMFTVSSRDLPYPNQMGLIEYARVRLQAAVFGARGQGVRDE